MSKRPQLGLLNDGMERMASQVAMKDIPDLDKLMFANHLWHADGDETGRYALAGEINLAHKVVYRTVIDELGTVNMPGIGKRRAIRYIGPKSGDVDKVVVHFPGFAHTHRYEDAFWYIQLLTRLAIGEEHVGFVTINPVGRAVAGADVAQGAGSAASLEDTVRDNDIVLQHVLETLKSPTRAKIALVLSGHSLGGRLAREQAYRLVQNQKRYSVDLNGLTLQASIGSKRWEDLRTKRYQRAIARHVLNATYTGMSENVTGLDLTLNECQRLFYGKSWSDRSVCEIAATGLNRGGSREFLDNTLGGGDYGPFKQLREFFSGDRNRVGIHAIVPSTDGILHRRHDSVQKVARLTHDIDGPHCFLVATAKESLREQIERALRTSFGLHEYKKLGKG